MPFTGDDEKGPVEDVDNRMKEPAVTLAVQLPKAVVLVLVIFTDCTAGLPAPVVAV
jgi:hypothetical protein